MAGRRLGNNPGESFSFAAAGSNVDDMTSERLLNEWLTSMTRRNLSRATLRRRKLNGTRFVAWAPDTHLKDRTTEEVQQWLDSLSVTPQSRGAYLGDLHSLYVFLERCGAVELACTEAIDRPRRPRYLPRPVGSDDLTVILEGAPPKLRLIFVLAALAGLRAGEIRNLDVHDLDRTAGVLWVRQGKGGKDRVVPICADLDREFARYGLGRSGPVVAKENGDRYAEHSISAMTHAYLRSRGVDVKLHQFRHWFASSALDASGNLRAVQDLLGHASPATTAIYTRISTAQTRPVTDMLHLPPAA